MEHRREVMMEPMRTSPMQSSQRQKSHEYSSTISPYKMDRTVKIKTTSSVATQTQDHLGEISELVYIDSFQDPSYMVTFDSFQDHLSGLDGKSSEIDSFQDHSEEEFRKLIQFD